MKRKPIRVDWDGIEDAFNNSDEDLVYLLDRITGHVALEGEGEEGDDDDFEGESPGSAPAPADETRLRIRPPDTATKIVWLEQFLETDAVSGPIEVELRRAIDTDDPAERIGEVLRENPEERERWFAFRAQRIRELIEVWLADNGIETVDSAPWRD